MSLATANPANIIPFSNGLLDITNIGGDMEMHAHTPEWFCMWCLPYEFDAKAECTRWEAFLDDVFNGDAESIDLLQRWFGLLLTTDTSYQKLLVMLGPRRSGKGTTLRLLQYLLGPEACTSPTLGSLASEFGLSQLLNKTVCVFPDAHLGRSSDAVRVLEIIKSVSGEDRVSVNRKYLDHLPNVRLKVRFVLTANEMPRLNDPSLALESRLSLVRFCNDYTGREDRELEGKLKAEASGVLNWALRGLHRLRKNRGFNVPGRSSEIIDDYRRVVSPVSAFVDDLCIVTGSVSDYIQTTTLYSSWTRWCEETGHQPGSDATFGSHVQAASTGVTKTRRRGEGGSRFYAYQGIKYRDEARDS